jgi:hypothetical protein
MESRGFGGQLTELSAGQSNRVRLTMLLGLALLLGGLLVRSFWASTSWLGVLLMICAGFLLLCAFYWFGRRVRRCHYRRARWRRPDTAIVVASLVMLAATLLIRAANRLSLAYYPFPPYSLVPEFNPWIGATLALLGLPGLLNLLQGTSK